MSLIAYCGLDCEECPAFLAHRNDDQPLRERTAREWSKAYEADISPGQINCTGCMGTGIQFPWCADGCPIRKCAIEREVSSCGLCQDYPCEKLGFIIENVPEAKQRLDGISSG